MNWIPVGFLLLVVAYSIAARRIQPEYYTWMQGWSLGIGFVPKSVRIAGVQYMVLSLFLGPLEIRWFVWRWANNGSATP